MESARARRRQGRLAPVQGLPRGVPTGVAVPRPPGVVGGRFVERAVGDAGESFDGETLGQGAVGGASGTEETREELAEQASRQGEGATGGRKSIFPQDVVFLYIYSVFTATQQQKQSMSREE